MTQKLKMGMVGGGRDAFIGGVHRMAARLDGEIELVAGAFSSDPEKAKRSGEDLSLDQSGLPRLPNDGGDQSEVARWQAHRLRVDSHSKPPPFPIARLFLEAGFNVVCDKPMTFDLGEALALHDLVKKSGKIFALTHNYTGYPMAKEARELVQRGTLGTILKVVAQYPQGWLLRPIDAEVKSKRCGGLTQSKRVLPLASLTLALTQRILHDISHL